MRIRPASRDTSDPSQSTGSDVVRGRIGVGLDPERHCETLTGPAAAEILCQDIRRSGSREGSYDSELEALRDCGECHTELRHTDSDRPRYEYRVADVCPSCVCPVLVDSDCLARPERIVDGTLIVGVTASSGEAFRSLVADLKERSESVGINQVRWNGGRRSGRDEVTKCQREAVRTALTIGYYESPRTATLEDLAERLGITKSAASQRLNAAERRLVRSAFDSGEPPV